MNKGRQRLSDGSSAPESAALEESVIEYAGDPVIAAFKKDVDRSLLVDNLRLTFDQRARRMNEFLHALDTLRHTQPVRRP